MKKGPTQRKALPKVLERNTIHECHDPLKDPLNAVAVATGFLHGQGRTRTQMEPPGLGSIDAPFGAALLKARRSREANR
jgi:hypothetical protein